MIRPWTLMTAGEPCPQQVAWSFRPPPTGTSWSSQASSGPVGVGVPDAGGDAEASPLPAPLASEAPPVHPETSMSASALLETHFHIRVHPLHSHVRTPCPRKAGG